MAEIKEKKMAYYETKLAKIKALGGNIPYKALKNMAEPDKPASWLIHALKPEATDK